MKLNNKLRFILVILTVFVSNVAFSQTNIRFSKNIRDDITTVKTNSETPRQVDNPTTDARDTIYSTGTVKQHGWFAPKGIITKETANHLRNFIRFTNKNKMGKWLKMEVLNSYGQYDPGIIKPYILKNSKDSLANQNWKSKIESACIFEFIPDPTGANIIQERAYDKDYNIVYAYSRTGIGESSEGRPQFIGSYKDFYGLPAEMRPQEGYSYGTLVKITEDEWGNDSIIEYIDSKGASKLNADLAAKEYFIYDKEGNLIIQQSRDNAGDLIIDNAGNCGIEFTYDAQGNMKTATFMDENWNPMHLPNTKNADYHAGVQCCECRYDDYGRAIEEIFVDVHGNPEENFYGCHRIVYEYDDYGNLKRKAGFDKNNRPVAYVFTGTSIYESDYDEKGRIIEERYLDTNQKPCSAIGYLSKQVFGYDENDDEILKEQYIAEKGEEELYYRYKKTRRYIHTRWGDGSSRVDSLDAKGRTTFVGFYGADGNLEMTEGRAYEIYAYRDEPNRTVVEKTDYDPLGDKVDVNGRCREVTVVDSLKWTKTIFRYGTDGFLTESYIYCYSPDFENLISQDDCNWAGIRTRCGGSSSVRYFQGNVAFNRKIDDSNSITHLYGVDEFGEPDYIASTSVLYCYSKQFPHSDTKFYDEHNAVVEDVDEARDRLPKIMTIEVSDSSAYKLGFRDNDVILIYGDYSVNLDSIVTYFTFREEWTLRTVVDAPKEKRMVVFRITDPSKNEYGLYEIKGLKGSCSELGFIPHIRYLTDKQLARIKQSISDEINKSEPIVAMSDFRKINNEGGSNYILLAYPEMFRSIRNKPYAVQVGDPSIVLGSCIKDRNFKWTKEDKADSEPFEIMLSSRKSEDAIYPCQDFFVTKDGCTLTHLVLDERAAVTNWFDSYISDEDFRRISKLYDDARDSIKVIIGNNKSIKSKSFYGNWKTQNQDTSQYHPEAYFSFNKNGTFEAQISNCGYIGYSEGTALFKLYKKVTGKWSNGGNWLFFYPYDEEESLSCVDLIGTDDEDLKHRAVSYLNSKCKTNKDDFLDKMNYAEGRISGDMYITSVKNDELEVQFSSGYRLTLLKTKDKVSVLTDADIDEENSSLQQLEQIDESCLLIGNWECRIPGIDESYGELSLGSDGKLAIELSAEFTQELNDTCQLAVLIDFNALGKWKPTSKGFMRDIDPESISVNCDIDLKGVGADTKEQMIPSLKEYFESQKIEIGMSLLDNFGTGAEVVAEVDSVKMVMNGNVLTRIPEWKSIVIGRVEGEEGYMAKNGYSGLFVILKWCDWDCKQSIDSFAAEFEKQIVHEKHILLLPLESIDGQDVFKDIIELTDIKTKLGLRLMDHSVSYNYFKRNILARYRNFKR